MLLFYTFLPEFGRGCNAPFDSKTCKALALLKLDNDFYDNFILGFGQTGILISHLPLDFISFKFLDITTIIMGVSKGVLITPDNVNYI